MKNKILKGYLVVMKDCHRNSIDDIFTEFIPSRDKDIVMDFVKAKGNIIGMVKYEVDFDKLTLSEKSNVIDKDINIISKYY